MDLVEKTFGFTGNKKIIYAFVKCKKNSHLLPAKPGLTGVYGNTQLTLYFSTALWSERQA